MTMHLARGLTTISTKKRKQKKLTQAQLEKLTVQWRQHNKDMRRRHMHDLQFKTFEDYLDYVQGKYKFKKQDSSFQSYTPNLSYRRDTPHIPSAGIGVGVATKKESQRYTGDLIVGIATMHKSNAVPVMRGTSQAEDIAKMRR